MINSHGGRRKREKKENVYILYERYNELTNWFYRRRRVSFSTRLFRVYSEFNVIPLPLDFQASLSVPLGNLSFNDDANIIPISPFKFLLNFPNSFFFSRVTLRPIISLGIITRRGSK